MLEKDIKRRKPGSVAMKSKETVKVKHMDTKLAMIEKKQELKEAK
jgi:hypothetical protein